MYYFWKKLCVDYKVTHLKMEPVVVIAPAVEKPYVCEIADCSAVSSRLSDAAAAAAAAIMRVPMSLEQ